MADEKDSVISTAEVDPAGEVFKNFLAGVTPAAKKVETPAVTPDVKDIPAASSVAEPKVADKIEKVEDETAETLKAKINGLEQELGRRKGQHSKVEQLEKELGTLKADLKKQKDAVVDDTPEAKLKAAIDKLTIDELIDKQIEFQDEQADARADLKLAERDGDTKAQEVATQRLIRARRTLAALEKGKSALTQRTQAVDASEKDFAKNLEAEVEGLFKDAYTLHPDLKDENSALFKAGDVEYRKRPHLAKAMGQAMSELVSLAYAVLRNPDLVGGTKATPQATEVRKDLLKNLDETTSKAFLKGGGASTTKTVVDYGQLVQTPTGLAEFEKLIAKTKGES